ncbi:unnamed protein product, partial [Arabidopsis halleri]
MADQNLWLALQHLNLGSERSPLKISSDTKNKRDAEHRLSLVVKDLHPSQNPAGIKVMMPKIWKLEGRITSRINEDGFVQFFFKKEHHLLNVLDNGPWTYKDWLVVVDRWTRRSLPDYLRIIRFWVKILNIPNDSKDESSINEIGEVLGHVDEIHIQQPTADRAGEVCVRVPIEITEKLIFARYFRFEDYGEPVLIRFIYDKLRRFCSVCGSITHLAAACNIQAQEVEQFQLPAPAPIQDPDSQGTQGRANQMEDIPHTPTEVAGDTMGVPVGYNLNMDISENQQQRGAQGDLLDFVHPDNVQDRINVTFAVRELGSASVPVPERGIKRKIEATAAEDKVSTSRRRTQEETKAVMWSMMQNLVKAGLYQSKPRIVLGDFNEIKNNKEKLGGPLRPDWQFVNFRKMLNVCGHHEVKTYGVDYTWIGNRSSVTIKSRLDRVVATTDWKDKFPKALVQLLDWVGSDHRPLLLNTDNNKWRGTKLFRYDNRWRYNKDVHRALQQTWNQRCSQLPPQHFTEALKRCRRLSSWKSKQNINSHKMIQQLCIALQKAYNSA